MFALCADFCLDRIVSEVTRVLESIQQGDAKAADELLPLVYEELRKLAAARMAVERDTSTLQPTALVHEAWLRLVGSQQQSWQNRRHFFAAAAEAMRRILIDHARRKHAQKRHAGAERLDLESVKIYCDTSFLVVLYVPNDHTIAALRHYELVEREPIPFSRLHRLELRTTVRQ